MLKQSLVYASTLDTEQPTSSANSSHLGHLDMHVFANIAHTRNDARKY